MRKHPFVNNQVYHVFSKSIAGYKVFVRTADYERFLEMIKFYQFSSNNIKFSIYYKMLKDKNSSVYKSIVNFNLDSKYVDVIAYCIMPTHFHFILHQVSDNGISKFMKNILDSYTRYFNLLNNRKGPLWQGRFKSVFVANDEQLLHLTRYIHLNPTSDKLVASPDQWRFSSYLEYLGKSDTKICNFDNFINVNPDSYEKFVLDRQDYQQKLAEIKHLIF